MKTVTVVCAGIILFLILIMYGMYKHRQRWIADLMPGQWVRFTIPTPTGEDELAGHIIQVQDNAVLVQTVSGTVWVQKYDLHEP